MSTSSFRSIVVVGLGYIGLPTAAMFASRGLDVLGVDTNPALVERINDGAVLTVEPALDALVRETVASGRLRAAVKPEAGDAFLLAVPTPFTGDGRAPDLSYIDAATDALAPVLEAGNLVVPESTIPVGTTERVAERLAAARPDLSFPQSKGEASDIRVAHCPERVLPGQVLRELVENDRVIGGMTPFCAARAVELYKHFVTGACVETNVRAAELAKLTENSFRDVNIAFANELSVICDRLGVDVWEVIGLANRHPRVDILRPGPGVGGHCIAVDPWFIVSAAPADARLIRTAREVNDAKPAWVLQKIAATCDDFLRANPARKKEGVTIACYGLAFKPDIDDLRESPALEIARALATRHKGGLLVVEPHIDTLPDGLGDAELVSVAEAQKRADIHVVLVAHNAFKPLPNGGDFVIDAVGL